MEYNTYCGQYMCLGCCVGLGCPMCTPWPLVCTNRACGWGVGGHGGPHSAAAATALHSHLRYVDLGVSANVWPNFQNLGQMLPQPTSVAPTVTTKRPPRQCAQRSEPTWGDKKNKNICLNQILKFNNKILILLILHIKKNLIGLIHVGRSCFAMG